jgi:hypothetical protein
VRSWNLSGWFELLIFLSKFLPIQLILIFPHVLGDNGVPDPQEKIPPRRIIDCYFRDVALTSKVSSSSSDSKKKGERIPSMAVTKGGKKVPTGGYEPSGVICSYRFSGERVSSSVVAVQADDVKVVAAYKDGSIAIWDKEDALVWTELKGRSEAVTSVQFDATRLVADGTYSVVVVHDFDVPFGSLSDEDLSYDIEAEVDEVEDGDEVGGDDDDNDGEDDVSDSDADGDAGETDGYPSSTS